MKNYKNMNYLNSAGQIPQQKSRERWFHHKFKALGTVNYITVRSPSENLAMQGLTNAYNLIQNFEDKYSRYKTSSLICKMNSALKLKGSGKGVKFRLDQETSELIDLSYTAFRSEEGLFDITSGILRYIWHSGRKSLPTKAELSSVKSFVGMEKLDWSQPYLKVPRGFELDLGGIGKEYILKKVTEMLKGLLPAGMVNLGGDLMTFGDRYSPEVLESTGDNPLVNLDHPETSPIESKEGGQDLLDGLRDGWSVGIADPSNPKRAIAVLRVKSGAVLTSGNYNRPIVINQKSYSHILHPKTLEPSDNIRGVTIYHRDPIKGGVLATVANILGGKARDYLEKRKLEDDNLRFFCVIPS